jgi:phage-related protein
MLSGGMMRKKLHLILSSLSDIMNLPISEKELKYILERVKENRKLYNKLWSFWIEYTHQNSK